MHFRFESVLSYIIEIESLLNRTRAVILLAEERGVPPPGPTLLNLVGNLEATRDKLEGEETETLEALLRLLSKAHMHWSLLEQYDVVVEAPIDSVLVGITVTLKMHQIVEERRDKLLYEMERASCAAFGN